MRRKAEREAGETGDKLGLHLSLSASNLMPRVTFTQYLIQDVERTVEETLREMEKLWAQLLPCSKKVNQQVKL